MSAESQVKASVGPARINSRKVDILPGDTILSAATRLGIEIPTLCHDPHLSPEGGCRLCVVHSEHHDTPLGACHTPLMPGMDLQTHHVAVEKMRRSVLQLHLESSPATGFNPAALKNAGRFQELLDLYRVRRVGGRSFGSGNEDRDTSHPMVRFEPAACIGCRLCLTTCDDLVGQHVFQLEDRASTARVRPAAGKTLLESPCTACGACIDRCPTGAMTDNDRRLSWPVENQRREVDTICGYCSVGCRIRVDAIDDVVRRIDGIAEDTATNPGGLLCQKGRFDHAFNHSWERITQPMLRLGAGFREVSWEEALTFIETRLTTILDAHGPMAFGALASTRASTESNYLLQKFCRSVIGSPHIDSSARLCHTDSFAAMRESIGVGAATASFADIDLATCLVVAGADPDTSHLVLAARIRQAVNDGAVLIVIDPRRTELADIADVFLQPKVGADIGIFHAIARALIDGGQIDAESLEEFEKFRQYIDQFPLDPVSAWAGFSEETTVRAVELLTEHRGATLFLHGTGLSQQSQGSGAVQAFLNLAILTNNLGKCGAGFLPFGGQNNLQGCLDAGAACDLLPGQSLIDDPEARARIETLWGKPLPVERGYQGRDMIAAAGRGELKSLWVMGHDLIHAQAGTDRTADALKHLDLLVVQDLFYSETARHAHVLLPAASGLEQDGVFINAERRLQLVRAAVSPPEEARPDIAIIAVVARRMGAQWPPQDAADVFREISRAAPVLFGGVSHCRLAETPAGIQWPCPTPDHPGTRSMPIARRRLFPIVMEPAIPAQTPDDSFPYTLLMGRRLEHHNAGSQTRRSVGRSLADRDQALLHPDDAAREGIKQGDRVQLESQQGQVVVVVEFSDRLVPGTIFLSHHFPQTSANRLTGSVLKSVAVRIVGT